MASFRAFSRDHLRLAALLVALALAMKALVPGGYMIGGGSKVLTLQICADAQGQHLTRTIAVPFAGEHDESRGEAGTGGPCAFGALAFGSLAGADGPLLALALVVILALGFAPTHTPLLPLVRRARPPLRGPPVSA